MQSFFEGRGGLILESVQLVLIVIMLFFIVMVILQCFKGGKITKKIRDFRTKSKVELTQSQIKKQNIYIKKHMGSIYSLGVNIATFSIVILLVMSGYVFRAFIVEKVYGGPLFLILGTLLLLAVIYAYFTQKIMIESQKIKKQYLNENPENSLKLFIYPDELIMRYKDMSKRTSCLMIIISILSFSIGILN
ncbi:hypothetical protein FC89_GL000549 [Liquorilactobacillus ghanensis DSM 18630]|uniref:Uncharacterized protein n=1 Tax=Liquorilactobacillus ghanensis DSM 18630 TaxID=1423750 RepID=A0A0R1VLB6_9LACO|nr:hypothetical protein FC89_GL000549 [Liquorilactobacillus ghanensis DSM 18630]